MMKPFNQLELINYEGAGNRTPVVDISSLVFTSSEPENVRVTLETDQAFRRWLKRKGDALNADSVMLFYHLPDGEHDFVTFVGEPDAPLTASFSEMCGNGIRALSLHIYITHPEWQKEFLKKGISIWAGMERRITINHVDTAKKEGEFSVDMGKFQHTASSLHHFINNEVITQKTLTSIQMTTGSVLDNFPVGVGFNGKEIGEPHLVYLFTKQEFEELTRKLALKKHSAILPKMQELLKLVGKEMTFNTELFPHCINVNIGVITTDGIYVITHERNLSPSKRHCSTMQKELGNCHCNTKACGTGGAAVANIAFLRGLVKSNEIKTIHQGGEITYTITPRTTIMRGPARRIER